VCRKNETGLSVVVVGVYTVANNNLDMLTGEGSTDVQLLLSTFFVSTFWGF